MNRQSPKSDYINFRVGTWGRQTVLGTKLWILSTISQFKPENWQEIVETSKKSEAGAGPACEVRGKNLNEGGKEEIHPLPAATEGCGGKMYPEYYKGVHGYEYRIEDVRPRKPDAERTDNVTT